MSAGRQARDVLLRTLSRARARPRTITLADVAELALAVGARLGLGREELDEVARAAELHDIGKMAIPDAILDEARPARRGRVELHAPSHR